MQPKELRQLPGGRRRGLVSRDHQPRNFVEVATVAVEVAIVDALEKW
jgi:hypothetical protein